MASNIVPKNAAFTNQLDAGRAIARSQVKLGRGIGLSTFRATKKPMPSIKMQLDDQNNSNKTRGQLATDVLIPPIKLLEKEFKFALIDTKFQEELEVALRDFVGRETPLYYAERLTKYYKDEEGKGPEIYIKREDLNHCGAHMMSNAIAQVMIAKRMGQKCVVAATGAGQHGVATAAACAKHDLRCIIFMGSEDIKKQSSNVDLIKLLGAKVKLVEGNFEDASLDAIVDWARNFGGSYYLTGTVEGPVPWAAMVREFQSVIGKETRRQAMEKWGGKPAVLVACIGSGSNALGLFNEFIKEEDVRLIGVEAAGFGLDSGKHSATLSEGHVGVSHENLSDILKDVEGPIFNRDSISAILEDLEEESYFKDIKEKGRLEDLEEESYFKDIKEKGRVEFQTVTDKEAVEAYKRVCKLEGIIPSLEASHAFAYLDKLCPTLPDGCKVVVNCSGRGD